MAGLLDAFLDQKESEYRTQFGPAFDALQEEEVNTVPSPKAVLSKETVALFKKAFVAAFTENAELLGMTPEDVEVEAEASLLAFTEATCKTIEAAGLQVTGTAYDEKRLGFRS